MSFPHVSHGYRPLAFQSMAFFVRARAAARLAFVAISFRFVAARFFALRKPPIRPNSRDASAMILALSAFVTYRFGRLAFVIVLLQPLRVVYTQVSTIGS